MQSAMALEIRHLQGKMLQGTQRAVELSTLGPHTLSFSSQTSSQLAAEERGVCLPSCTA